MGKKVDLTGQRFGKLVAVSEVAERDRHKRVLWKCLCDCGKQIQVAGEALKSGNTKSCGCITTAINLVGQRFGLWTVLGDSGKRYTNGSVLYTCICECGNKKDVSSNSLIGGKSTCCGHLRNEDLRGKKFGELEVLCLSNNRKNGSRTWLCKCSCGNHTEVVTNQLKGGYTKSCGCLVGGKVDIRGYKFGRLTVVDDTGKRLHGSVVWRCVCDCGKESEVTAGNLRGGTESCGCSIVKNIIGQRFGRLTVISYSDVKSKSGDKICICACDCGMEKQVLRNDIVSGKTKSCGCLIRRGVNHPKYNPKLSDEHRMKSRLRMSDGDFRVWSKMVKDRDNYTCQICGDNKGGNLNSHHLNGWNAFPKQRFDLENGTTLCTDCHNDFHNMYGRGGNTREQFDEYAASKTLVLN